MDDGALLGDAKFPKSPIKFIMTKHYQSACTDIGMFQKPCVRILGYARINYCTFTTSTLR